MSSAVKEHLKIGLTVLALVGTFAAFVLGFGGSQGQFKAQLIEHDRRITAIEQGVQKIPIVANDVEWIKKHLQGKGKP